MKSLMPIATARKRRSRSIGVLLASVALVAMAAAPAMADGPNLVVNGNFASPHTTSTLMVTSLPGWMLIDDVAEVDGAEVFTPRAGAPAGTQSIDLNTDRNTSIEQSVPTTAGHTYTLTFQLAGNPSAAGVVTGNVSVDRSIVMPISFNTVPQSRTNMGWVLKSYTFVATGPSTAINFQSTTPSESGPVITEVSVVETPGAGSPMMDWQIGGLAVLVLLGLIALATMLRRRSPATAR